MGAIVGILRASDMRVEQEELSSMLATMPYRISDQQGVWTDSSVGLGEGVVFTTPESVAAIQPLTDDRYALVADARIDNRSELIRELQPGASPDAVSDSRLILEAYRKWGDGCVDHLIGDFVFAVWDKSLERLCCVRDHFGMRPLYYHHIPHRQLAFATEIKALLAVVDVPDRLNESRLADYILELRTFSESTIHDQIVRLPPAHILTVDRSGLDKRRYYVPGPDPAVSPDWTDEEYVIRFRKLFEEAVRCRLRSAFPVGSELSGGLDSSSVTAVARDLIAEDREQKMGPLHTFSVVFETVTSCDESEYIDAVLRDGNVSAHKLVGDRVGPLTHLKRQYETLDEGLVGNNQQFGWEVLKAAHEADVRVLLNGVDGDYTVGYGPQYLSELAAQGKWAEFKDVAHGAVRLHRTADHKHSVDEVLSSESAILRAYGFPVVEDLARRGKWLQFWRSINQIHHLFGIDRKQLLRSYWKQLFVPHAAIRIRRKIRHERKPVYSRLVDRSFSERIQLADRLRQLSTPDDPTWSMRERQQGIFTSHILASGLELQNHRAAVHGIEVRSPFMDKRLIEYCLAMPPRLSFSNGWTRYVMRVALEDVLPKDVAWRVGKGNLRPAFIYGLSTVDGDRLGRYLNEAETLREYLDLEYVAELFRKRDWSDIRTAVTLANVATLGIWLGEQFFYESRESDQAQM